MLKLDAVKIETVTDNWNKISESLSFSGINSFKLPSVKRSHLVLSLSLPAFNAKKEHVGAYRVFLYIPTAEDMAIISLSKLKNDKHHLRYHYDLNKDGIKSYILTELFKILENRLS